MERWQERVQAKRHAALEKIPIDWRLPKGFLQSIKALESESTDLIALNAIRRSGLLSSSELEITENYTASQLVKKLASGSFSAEAVTRAFSKRAAIAEQLTSCLTETFFDQAIERARFLDDYLQREGRVVGPLHGLPISVKDSYNIKGVPSTIGYVSFLDNELPETNSTLIDVLLQLGAVLYVKTNIPQSMMVADSENNIFGRTLNPLRTSMTAGGSTGGEGALIALRGSLIGVGTDIGGSIRVPALCCGLYGFRPTTGRVPYGGIVHHGLPGHPGILATAGPLTTSLTDTELFLTSVISAKPWKYDSTTHAIPWLPVGGNVAFSPLRIGVLAEDPKWPLHPPVRRAIHDAISLLKDAGHSIIQLSHDVKISASTGLDLSLQYFSLDDSNTFLRHIEKGGEPPINALKVLGLDKPSTNHSKCTIQDLAALDLKRVGYGDAWSKQILDLNLDIIIGPGAQNTAVPHDSYGLFPYTVMWNLLDYPASIIPFSRVSKEADPEPLVFEAPAQGPPYDPEILDGLPCAIQIIAPRFHDEKCLAISKVVDSILNGKR
ncbi:amidase signature domain-containing protein [Talaromyces proteolyticus]|uniref:Amidase signature domain-containing protein n=1 Tax=Talaromyces proteolyticus TaxID=1131652 RepID=A0AAD4KK66_9EURO|nr:amidase signature domain-containing protein [Talaromyces proteolyticus]KAH8694111.1 amidase signature domain-containing protein [Talaromyces proteolyticus]